MTTVDGIAGAVTLVAGANITITDNSPVAGSITIASTGGGGTNPVVFVQTADSVTTANAATTLFGTGVGSLTVPANALHVGSVIRVTLSGYTSIATAGAGTHTLLLTLGGVTVATGTSTIMNAILNGGWTSTVEITCRTTGGTGTVAGTAQFIPRRAVTTGQPAVLDASGSAGPATIATTIANVLDLTLNNGNAVGTYTTTGALVELIG